MASSFLLIRNSQSAFEVGVQERLQHKLTTLIEDLDNQLGGCGLPTGKITEIYGVPGIGRTQFVLQLVANCHIPAAFGGLEGEALFIDTEGSFSVRRLEEIAAGLGEGLGVTPKSVLAGTHVIHAVGWAELAAVIYALPRLLDAHPKVRLVAIDSITFPIHSMDTANGSSCRTRVVAALMQSLCTVASERGLVVVITNHLTTRIDGQSSLLAPSLGDGFGHSSTFRLRLFWSQDTRYVAVDKAPVVTSSASGPCTPIPFTIVQCGIRPAKSLK